MTLAIKFRPPQATESDGAHHARAAAANTAVVDHAEGVLRDALSGTAKVERILLKAAAGAGKSHALRRLVEQSVAHPASPRVAVVAFTHRQTHGLAAPLGESLGKKAVCLFVSEKRLADVPDDVRRKVAIASTTTAIPPECRVVIATCHKLGAPREQGRQVSTLGAANDGKSPYDVLFVDEAWQIPHHLFDDVSAYAPIIVGVGDVGQLPPLESGANPWRGDPGYSPFRAWPTDFDDDEQPGPGSCRRSGGRPRGSSASGAPSTRNGLHSTVSPGRTIAASTLLASVGTRQTSGDRSGPAFRPCSRSTDCRRPSRRTSTCR